jgi:hypothetical protein
MANHHRRDMPLTRCRVGHRIWLKEAPWEFAWHQNRSVYPRFYRCVANEVLSCLFSMRFPPILVGIAGNQLQRGAHRPGTFSWAGNVK